jgi:hypothetical protein
MDHFQWTELAAGNLILAAGMYTDSAGVKSLDYNPP